MVKVKRIVHLEDKNVAEDDGKKGDSVLGKGDRVSGKGDSAAVKGDVVSGKADAVCEKGDSNSAKNGAGLKRDVIAKRDEMTPAKKAKIETEEDAPDERRSVGRSSLMRHN